MPHVTSQIVLILCGEGVFIAPDSLKWIVLFLGGYLA